MSMVLHWSAREQKCRLDEGLYLSANRLNSADYDLDIAAVSGPHLLSFSLSGPVFLSLSFITPASPPCYFMAGE